MRKRLPTPVVRLVTDQSVIIIAKKSGNISLYMATEKILVAWTVRRAQKFWVNEGKCVMKFLALWQDFFRIIWTITTFSSIGRNVKIGFMRIIGASLRTPSDWFEQNVKDNSTLHSKRFFRLTTRKNKKDLYWQTFNSVHFFHYGFHPMVLQIKSLC